MRPTVLRRYLLLCGLLLAASVAAAPASPLNVLFVGNSYTSVNDLPAVFAKVAEGAGFAAPRVTVYAPGGQTLVGHCRDTALLRLLDQPYDVIVLQEQSQIPAMSANNAALRRSSLDACQWLNDYIQARHSGTKIVLYETWARHASAWKNPSDVAGLGRSPEEMQARLGHWYAEAARRIGARVAPVGEAWALNYRGSQPALLHGPDFSHPSPAGTYLTALVLVGVIYDTAAETRFPGPFTAAAPARRHLLDVARQALRAAVTP